MVVKPKVIDLFCGCGGFGLGAKLAGFDVTHALDIDATLHSSYEINFPKTAVITADIGKINESDWVKLIQDSPIDGVIGGPPCQGYSRIGKANIDDPRRSLISDFFRNIDIIRPIFFIMENVEGLLDKKNIVELEKATSLIYNNYFIDEPIVVDASEMGAPTKRKRVIVFGYRKDKEHIFKDFKFKTKNNQRTNVHEAIFDLPHPIDCEIKNDHCWSSYRINNQLSDYALRMRTPPKRDMGSKDYVNKITENLVSGLWSTKHTKPVIERFSNLKPGETDRVSRAKRLAWDGFCPTLRAGTGSDKGSFQSVRPIHPSEPRVISVREAARLQGFPDWFMFHHTKWHSFRMIGNSVSPIVSENLLRQVKQCIQNENKE